MGFLLWILGYKKKKSNKEIKKPITENSFYKKYGSNFKYIEIYKESFSGDFITYNTIKIFSKCDIEIWCYRKINVLKYENKKIWLSDKKDKELDEFANYLLKKNEIREKIKEKNKQRNIQITRKKDYKGYLEHLKN